MAWRGRRDAWAVGSAVAVVAACTALAVAAPFAAARVFAGGIGPWVIEPGMQAVLVPWIVSKEACDMLARSTEASLAAAASAAVVAACSVDVVNALESAGLSRQFVERISAAFAACSALVLLTAPFAASNVDFLKEHSHFEHFDAPLTRGGWACIALVTSMRILASLVERAPGIEHRRAGKWRLVLHVTCLLEFEDSAFSTNVKERMLLSGLALARFVGKQGACRIFMRWSLLSFTLMPRTHALRAAAEASIAAAPEPYAFFMRIGRDYMAMVFFFLYLSSCFDCVAVAMHLVVGRLKPAFDNPLIKSQSVRDCWSRRWNLVMHNCLRDAVFACPGMNTIPIALRAAAAFLASGISHEYLVKTAFPRDTKGWPGYMTAFFMIQWVVVSVQIILQQVVKHSHPKKLEGRKQRVSFGRVLARIHSGLERGAPITFLFLTVLCITPSCSLFLEPFRENGLFVELSRLYT